MKMRVDRKQRRAHCHENMGPESRSFALTLPFKADAAAKKSRN